LEITVTGAFLIDFTVPGQHPLEPGIALVD
jgi:hypothetical protein